MKLGDINGADSALLPWKCQCCRAENPWRNVYCDSCGVPHRESSNNRSKVSVVAGGAPGLRQQDRRKLRN